MRTNPAKFDELIRELAKKDEINRGVAKARFAGQANYSVPSLERLMRGESASDDHIRGTMKAIKAYRLKFRESDLFHSAPTEQESA